MSLVSDVSAVLCRELHCSEEDLNGLGIGQHPKWDSLGHFNIIFALEIFFKINFSADEIQLMTSVEDICKTVERKIHNPLTDGDVEYCEDVSLGQLMRKLKSKVPEHSPIFLHASLVEAGLSKNDPGQIIEPLLNLSLSNPLVIPIFSSKFNSVNKFDWNNTPGNIGLLSKLLVQNSVGSIVGNPFHRFCVIGSDNALVHDCYSSFGRGSLLDNFMSREGYVVWIGEVRSSFTFAHFVEEQVRVKYRRLKHFSIDILKDGATTKVDFGMHVKREEGFFNNRKCFEFCLSNGVIKEINLQKNKLYLSNSKLLYGVLEKAFSEDDYKFFEKNKAGSNHIYFD